MANLRRVVLWVWASLALLAVAYTCLLFFASEDAPGNLQDMRHGNESGFASWTRVVPVPATVEGPVRTVAENAYPSAPIFGEPGDVLLVRQDGVPSPFLARALVWVVANTSTNTTFDVPALRLTNVTSFTLVNVGRVNATTGQWEHRDLLVNLTGYAHQTGFILKADSESVPMRFHGGTHTLTRPVPEADAQQKVVLLLDGWSQVLKIGLSILFAILPLSLLIFTQTARPAPPGFDAVRVVNNLRCPECGSSFPEDATFCFRCGAERRR